MKAPTLSQGESESDYEQRDIKYQKEKVAVIELNQVHVDTINKLETENKEMRRMLVVLKQTTLDIKKWIHVTKKN